MGLDMYLHKRCYQYQMTDGTLTSDLDALTFDNFGRSNWVYIVTQAAYWRKANQIHKWFVDNVCEGNDDCKEYYCGKDSIKKLVDVCRSVLGTLQGAVLGVDKKNAGDYKEDDDPKDIIFDIEKLPEIYSSIRYYYKIQDANVAKKFSECAEDLLPTQEGFFFGETSYGIGYILDLMKTILMLEDLLANGRGYDYYYEASW